MILDSGLLIPGLAVLVVVVVFSGIIGKFIKKLLVNSILGIVAIGLAAVFLDVGIALTPVSVLLIVLGGLPGSLLTIVLAWFDIAFAGSGVGVSPEIWAVIGQIMDVSIGMM